MQPEAVMSAERLSFGEYVDRRGMSRMLRAAFETHCKQGIGFNYRTEQDWDQVRSEFLAAHRGRRG